MKKIYMLLGLVMIMVLAGCDFSFEDFWQTGNAVENENFEIVIHLDTEDSPSGNKTTIAGLRLPNGCEYVSGNMTRAQWWSGSTNLVYYDLLYESDKITAWLDNSTCEAKEDYRWIGLEGTRETTSASSDFWLGEAVIVCDTAGEYQLDIAVGIIGENITNYFCNNTIIVGEPGNPPDLYTHITTCDQLENIEINLTGRYKLDNDIDCINSSFDGVNDYFRGHFDGQGHTISNLKTTMFDYTRFNLGNALIENIKFNNLTGKVVDDAGFCTIRNIEVTNSNGGVIGDLDDSRFGAKNISNTNSIVQQGTPCGGVIDDLGGSSKASMLSFTGNITCSGSLSVGGCIGTQGDSNINELKTKNSIITGSSSNFCGGIVGNGADSSITKSTVENTKIECYGHVGGIVGQHSTGSIFSNILVKNVTLIGGSTTNFGVGGVAGETGSSDITKVLVTELNMTGNTTSRIGIIVGRLNGGNRVVSINESYYDSDKISGYLVCGNVTGNVTQCNDTNVEPRNTSDLQQQSTYTNWDFINIFGIFENDYPHLQFDDDYCIPIWVCVGYSSCNTSDLAPCNSATDLAGCGVSYTGNYSEFSPQACNYCAYDLDLVSLGYCDIESGIRPDLYQDLNFVTCCNITTLESDCAFGNATQGYINASCSTNYLRQYETDDVVKVVIDFIVSFGIGIVALIGIVAMILIYKFVRGKT